MQPDDRVYVAGHRGMVGSAIVRCLKRHGHTDIVLRTRSELDLTDRAAVERFFSSQAIDHIFAAAARVGGIGANAQRGGEFIRDNLLIQTHLIDAAQRHGVRRFMFLGSSCIYPRMAPQPIPETALLTGPLEPTNAAYAVAKIAGLTMCEAYRRQHGFDAFTVMPCNVYGPGDNFDPVSSHVVAALMRRLHEARIAGHANIVAWGSGRPLREFVFVDDLAEACILLMREYRGGGHVNAGSGTEVSIRELADLIADAVGYRGRIEWDPSQPDGTPRKLMDSSRLLSLGWRPRMPLAAGLKTMYGAFLSGRADKKTDIPPRPESQSAAR